MGVREPFALCFEITGGNTIAVKNRYEALGFKDIFLKASHKLEIFLKWMEDNGLETDEVIYFGDDIPDLKCMRIAGLPCAPEICP